jgi:hypothetical protein
MRVLLILFILSITSFSSISQLSESNKNEFNKNIREGDSYFSQGKFLEAKDFYEKALALNPSDKYALNQRDKSIANSKDKTGQEEGKNYQKIINKADEKFNNNDLENAKSLYQRALGLKPNDTYPKRKIEEIDAKLNPVKVEKAAPLPDLGVSSELSLNDAEKILSDAEIKRQNRKNTNVDSNSFKSINSDSKLLENRLKEINNSNVNIKDATDKTELFNANSKSKQDSSILKIKQTENKIIEDNSNSSKLQSINETNKSILISNKLEDIDSILNDSKTVGAEMDVYITMKMDRFTDSIQIADKKIKEELNHKINELNYINVLEEKKTTDNYKITKDLNSKVDSIFINLDKSDMDKNSLINKSHINSNQSLSEKELYTVNNSDSISDIISKYQSNNSLKINLNDGKSIDSLNTIDKTNKIDKSNQLQALNQVTETDENQNDAIKTKINQNTKESIIKVNSDNELIEKSGKSNQDISIEKLKKIDQKDQENQTDNFKKNQEEIYSKTDQLNTNISKINSANKTGNSTNDGILISNQTNEISQKYESEEKKIVENKKDIEDFLDNIESKNFKFDDKIANSVGTLYPEGITEESFNKNDANGLAYAVVTRRIVVKNGYGAIYIRTVSKNSITYSKNGLPTTEHSWQIETQDAKLKRN